VDRLTEIQERLRLIAEEGKVETADLDKLIEERDSLVKEMNEINVKAEKRKSLIEKRANIVKGIDTGEIPVTKIEKPLEVRSLEIVKGIGSVEYRDAFFKALLGKELNEVEKREYSSAANSAGAVIPIQTSEMIVDMMFKTAPMLAEIELFRVPGNLRIGVENVRDAAAVHVENAAVVPAADSLAFVTLAGLEFMKVIRISATVKAMAIPQFEQWLVKVLAEDIAEQIENEIILGTNVQSGIEDSQAWVNNTNGIDYGVAVTYDNIVDLIALLPARYDKNAKFLMNKAMFYNQIAKIQDADGMPVVVKDVSDGAKMRIMGYPVLISDSVGAGNAYLGDYKKIFGNLSQDVEVVSSAQSGFLSNSLDFRGTAIFDCIATDTAAFRKLFT